jgi:3-hydroxymyristoyl/3-hydroxydecanoyl-(acyl carrier protein) dehydratase
MPSWPTLASTALGASLELVVTTIEDWLPHRPPFRFVDEIVAVAGETGEFVLRLAPDDPRLHNGHLQPLLLVEALAQSAAVFNSYTQQGGTKSGVLVEIQASLYGAAAAGDVVRLYIQRILDRGSLAKFRGRALVNDTLLIETEFMVMRTNAHGEIARG